jgi:hypothetical protein
VRTPFGRISRFAVVVIAVLVLAVAAGLIVPGGTGKWIEVGAWLAIILLVLSRGVRTTPVFGEQEGKRGEDPRPFPFRIRR